MFRKAVGKFAGLIGTSIEVIDTIIFSKIGNGVIPIELFKPFAGLVAGATAARLYAEWDKKSKTQLLVETIPGAMVQVAIFAVEGPAVAYIFTAAVGVGSALMMVEAVQKYRTEEGLSADEKFNLFIQTGKKAGILATLTYGGVGKVFELIKTGCAITPVHKIASWGTAAFSALAAAKGAISFFSCPAESKEKNLSVQTDYTVLKDDDLQMADLEKGVDASLGVNPLRM